MFPASAFSGDTRETARNRNTVRSGPANFYSLLYVLPKGTKVEVLGAQDGWLQIKINDASAPNVEESARNTPGWISKRCFQKKKSRKDQGFLKMKSDGKVSKASVSAAVRGFATRYGKASTAAVNSLITTHSSFFTPADYKAFRELTRKRATPSGKSFDREVEAKYFREYAPSVEEEGIGLAIAARVLGKRFVHDKKKLEYVNLVAAYLAKFSSAYDQPFAVFLVNQPGYNAGSAPGGFIFLNEDLVDLCENEADLAAVIAHEMAHIILLHGLQERQERGLKVKLESRFEALEDEAGWEDSDAEAELSVMAMRAYDFIVKPRLQHYEFEADAGAMVLLARAGYEPQAIIRMVGAMESAIKRQEYSTRDMGDGDLDEPFQSLDFTKRRADLTAFWKKHLSGVRGATLEKRFRSVFSK